MQIKLFRSADDAIGTVAGLLTPLAEHEVYREQLSAQELRRRRGGLNPRAVLAKNDECSVAVHLETMNSAANSKPATSIASCAVVDRVVCV